MRHIYREVIQVDDQWHEIELRGPILHVATRHEDAIEFWHLHDTDQPVTKHAFRVVGTGHQMAPALALYVGSAITPSGTFVWHLMEHERPKPFTGEQRYDAEPVPDEEIDRLAQRRREIREATLRRIDERGLLRGDRDGG